MQFLKKHLLKAAPSLLVSLVVLLGLAACGSPGPSDARIEQDTMDVIKAWAIPWVTQDVFNIVKRRELAEDRVEYDIDLAVKFDRNAFDLENVRNPGTNRSNQNQMADAIQQLLPKNKILLSVLYRQTSKDFWELDQQALKRRLQHSGIVSKGQLFLGGGLNGLLGRRGPFDMY